MTMFSEKSHAPLIVRLLLGIVVSGFGSFPVALAQDPPAPQPMESPKSGSKASLKVKTDPSPPGPPRIGAWNLGFDVRKLSITPEFKSYKIDALAPDVNIGYAWIHDAWWIMVRAHLAVGPTSQKFPDSPPLDFEGYGFSVTTAYTLSSQNLRNQNGDYGLELGIETYELLGRSYRRQNLSDGDFTENLALKVRWIGVTPAVFVTFLKEARPQGNRPEWLVTRNEGYRISLGAVVPVQKSWDLRFDRSRDKGGFRGTYQGIFPIASMSLWLGI